MSVRATETLKVVVFAVALIIVVLFVWTGDVLNDEYDPLTVTVDYDCRLVAINDDDIPRPVVEECARILEEFNIKSIKRDTTVNSV